MSFSEYSATPLSVPPPMFCTHSSIIRKRDNEPVRGCKSTDISSPNNDRIHKTGNAQRNIEAPSDICILDTSHLLMVYITLRSQLKTYYRLSLQLWGHFIVLLYNLLFMCLLSLCLIYRSYTTSNFHSAEIFCTCRLKKDNSYIICRYIRNPHRKFDIPRHNL
jgi:hypothetical protein